MRLLLFEKQRIFYPVYGLFHSIFSPADCVLVNDRTNKNNNGCNVRPTSANAAKQYEHLYTYRCDAIYLDISSHICCRTRILRLDLALCGTSADRRCVPSDRMERTVCRRQSFYKPAKPERKRNLNSNPLQSK